MSNLTVRNLPSRFLEITSDLHSLSTVRTFVFDAIREITEDALPEEHGLDLVFAVTEAVTNVIRHSYHLSSGQPIQCRATIDRDQIEFVITHEGDPFDPPAKVPELEEPREGGMGLFIMSQCVDSVRYAQLEEGRQCIYITKLLMKGADMDNTVEQVGNVAVFEVNFGALDAGSVGEFRQDLTPFLEGQSQLLLDLSKVEYVDSAGLGGIVSSLKHLRAQGGEIKVYGLQKSVRALFELVRMHKLIDVFNDRDEAIASFDD